LSDEQIYKYLQKLGLTKNQAKIFINLLMFSEATVSELQKQVKIQRPQVYNLLNQLQKMGIISVKLTNPKRFYVQPPDEAINNVIAKAKDKIRVLEKGKTEAVVWLRKLQEKGTLEKEEDEKGLIVLSTQREVLAKVPKLLLNAKISIDALITPRELKAIPETEFKHIIKQKSKKVKIRIISEVNEENMKEAEWLSRYVKIGCLQRTPLRLMVIDKNEVLIDTSKDSFEKEALLTKSREWVNAFQGVFDLIWSISTPFKKP